ncbi:MAG: hypothetical protein KGH75_10435 [Rhodospirillales bacterium]|nr:hypothetical protein [Rhodospirillales bacterium]
MGKEGFWDVYPDGDVIWMESDDKEESFALSPANAEKLAIALLSAIDSHQEMLCQVAESAGETE